MTIMYTTPVFRTQVPSDVVEWLVADYSEVFGYVGDFGYVGSGVIEIRNLTAALNIVSNSVEVYEDEEDGTMYLLVEDVAYPFYEA